MRNLIRRVAAYYIAARHRAQRRKSPWNFILVPLCFGSAIAVGYALFKLVWLFHTFFYPDHQLRDFWQSGITFRSFVPSFLMVFSLMPGALGTGFMFGNVVAWLVPPARRTFDAEAQGYPGTSFPQAMGGLFKFTLWTLPSGLAVALTAAYFLKSLR